MDLEDKVENDKKLITKLREEIEDLKRQFQN